MARRRSHVMVMNALTFDIEDYYHSFRSLGLCPPDTWTTYERRVEKVTHQLLDTLDTYGLKATCFVLGWVAEHHPGLVQEIARRGHEVASHGYWHELIYDQGPTAFRSDLERAKGITEDQLGAPVLGYRAPAFSVTSRNPWALDIVAELGFQYDSSVFPIQGHDVYGIPDAPRQPWKARPGLLEIPLSTARLMGRNLPVGGGGYFRFFPYPLTRWLLRRINAEGNAVVVYLHPWEFDKDQPVLSVPWKSRFRHYFNIHRVAPRFARLCADFQLGPIREVFADDLQSGDSGKGLPRSQPSLI